MEVNAINPQAIINVIVVLLSPRVSGPIPWSVMSMNMETWLSLVKLIPIILLLKMAHIPNEAVDEGLQSLSEMDHLKMAITVDNVLSLIKR